jgi:hypothetical protein
LQGIVQGAKAEVHTVVAIDIVLWLAKIITTVSFSSLNQLLVVHAYSLKIGVDCCVFCADHDNSMFTMRALWLAHDEGPVACTCSGTMRALWLAHVQVYHEGPMACT